MTHREAWALALPLAGGGLLGALYFGGLWWSVRRVAEPAHSAAWFAGGLILRLGMAMAGLYLAARSGIGPLLACLAGFVGARMALVRRAGRSLAALDARRAP